MREDSLASSLGGRVLKEAVVGAVLMVCVNTMFLRAV